MSRKRTKKKRIWLWILIPIFLVILIVSIFFVIRQSFLGQYPIEFEYRSSNPECVEFLCKTFYEGDRIITNKDLLWDGDGYIYSEQESGSAIPIRGMVKTYYNIQTPPAGGNTWCCDTIEEDYQYNCGPFSYLNGNLYDNEPLTAGNHIFKMVGYKSNGRYPQTCEPYEEEWEIEVLPKEIEPECETNEDCRENEECIEGICTQREIGFWDKIKDLFKDILGFIKFWD